MKTSFQQRSLLCCALALTLSGLSCPETQAQAVLSTAPYVQHFDNIALGLPQGWQVDTGATAIFTGYNLGSGSAYFINTPGTTSAWSNNSGGFKNMASVSGFPVFAGTTSALQMAAPNRALGIRQVAATDARIAFVFEIANTNNLQSFILQFKLQSPDSNASRITTWAVDYGIGSNPSSFTTVPASGIMTTGDRTYASNTVTVNFGNALDNRSGPVYIRIISHGNTAGSGSRPSSAIDDFVLTWAGTPPPTHMQLTNHTPSGNNIPLNTSDLTLSYNHSIEAGNGQIDLYKSGTAAPVMTFTVPATTGVTITDSTVALSGIILENNTHYYVHMTEGTFRQAGDTLPNEAISDSLSWSFTTIDTTTPSGPLPLPFTSLNETFTGCINMPMETFKAYSISGDRVWYCSDQGRTDAHAVQISGVVSGGISESNMDWLISTAPFDVSAMHYPQLGLWQKKRFPGNAHQYIRISTDYIPGNHPETATWISLPVQAIEGIPATDNWTQLTGIDLAPYKNTPFYLAFTYQCGTDGAYELTCDDITITEKSTLDIGVRRRQDLDMQVLGTATPGLIRLAVATERPSPLLLDIFNLDGRQVYSKKINTTAKKEMITLSGTGLPAGMYFIRARNYNEQVQLKLSLQ